MPCLETKLSLWHHPMVFLFKQVQARSSKLKHRLGQKNDDAIRNSWVSPRSLPHPFLLWPPSQEFSRATSSRLSCTTAPSPSWTASWHQYRPLPPRLWWLDYSSANDVRKPMLRMQLSHSHPLDVKMLSFRSIWRAWNKFRSEELILHMWRQNFLYIQGVMKFLRVCVHNLEAAAALGFGAASVGAEKVSAVQPCHMSYSSDSNQLWWAGLQADNYSTSSNLCELRFIFHWACCKTETQPRFQRSHQQATSGLPRAESASQSNSSSSWSCEIMWNLRLTRCRTRLGHLNLFLRNPGNIHTSGPKAAWMPRAMHKKEAEGRVYLYASVQVSVGVNESLQRQGREQILWGPQAIPATQFEMVVRRT